MCSPKASDDPDSYGGRARYSKTRLENWVADRAAEAHERTMAQTVRWLLRLYVEGVIE